MKETIYTIPINEAFDANTECPFCFIQDKLESDSVEYTIGAVMAPEYRMESNKKGFCSKHFSMLYAIPNKLSLALLLDTHLTHLRELVDSRLQVKSVMFGGINHSQYASLIHGTLDACLICEKTESDMKR